MRTVDLSFTLKPHFRWKVASERRSTHESGAKGADGSPVRAVALVD